VRACCSCRAARPRSLADPAVASSRGDLETPCARGNVAPRSREGDGDQDRICGSAPGAMITARRRTSRRFTEHADLHGRTVEGTVAAAAARVPRDGLGGQTNHVAVARRHGAGVLSHLASAYSSGRTTVQ
jgi:hypothetical protein